MVRSLTNKCNGWVETSQKEELPENVCVICVDAADVAPSS